MKTLTILFAATALMASVSSAALAQVSAGGALDTSGGVSVDAGSTSVDAGASTNANANASSNSSTNASGSNGNLNAGASTATGADATLNYGTIISDLNTSTTTATDIEGLGSDVEIDVVTLSELRGNAGENANALDQALSGQSSGMADLRAAIERNSELQGEIDAALSAEGDFTMDDIVSISTSAEGHLTLVVDDEE